MLSIFCIAVTFAECIINWHSKVLSKYDRCIAKPNSGCSRLGSLYSWIVPGWPLPFCFLHSLGLPGFQDFINFLHQVFIVPRGCICCSRAGRRWLVPKQLFSRYVFKTKPRMLCYVMLCYVMLCYVMLRLRYGCYGYKKCNWPIPQRIRQYAMSILLVCNLNDSVLTVCLWPLNLKGQIGVNRRNLGYAAARWIRSYNVIPVPRYKPVLMCLNNNWNKRDTPIPSWCWGLGHLHQHQEPSTRIYKTLLFCLAQLDAFSCPVHSSMPHNRQQAADDKSLHISSWTVSVHCTSPPNSQIAIPQTPLDFPLLQYMDDSGTCWCRCQGRWGPQTESQRMSDQSRVPAWSYLLLLSPSGFWTEVLVSPGESVPSQLFAWDFSISFMTFTFSDSSCFCIRLLRLWLHLADPCW